MKTKPIANSLHFFNHKRWIKRFEKRNLNLRCSSRLSLCIIYFFTGNILFLTSSISLAEPYMVESASTSFGARIVPQTGSCHLDYDTSLLTSTAGNICVNNQSGTRGHFKVFATPHTTVRIVVRPHNDDGNGVAFFPDGVIFSDSTTPIAFVENSTTNIDSGTSGIVEIYIGGVLTLVSKTSSSTTYTFLNEIDFIEIP